MSHVCSVPECSSSEKNNPNLSFHVFPQAGDKNRVWVEGKSGTKELMDRQQAWLLKLKIGEPIKKYTRVCSLHFVQDDYFYRDPTSTQKKILKKTAVPSRNLPGEPSTNEESACCSVPSRNLSGEPLTKEESPSSDRAERLMHRNSIKEQTDAEECFCDETEPASRTEDEIDAAQGLLQLLQCQPAYNGPKTFREFEVQVNTPTVSTLCDLITTDSALNSFTGINSCKMLDTIVQAVESVYRDKRSHRLTIRQRIVLVMTKLKCDLTYSTLAVLFGISHQLCQMYINEMIPTLSSVLSCLIRFPDFSEIQKSMPKCFETFQNVRVVLDCTEIVVQKPKCLCCRIRFYSQYKSNNTVKFMTGVSPGGLITFISEPYGGRASDKTIFLQSDLILKLESSRDAIMVDKGFLIDDICHQFKIQLIRPPFLRDRQKMSAEEALLNVKIAAARVHIERVNQRIKIFKILCSKMQWSLVKRVGDIFKIACAITNLSNPILADHRFLRD